MSRNPRNNSGYGRNDYDDFDRDRSYQTRQGGDDDRRFHQDRERDVRGTPGWGYWEPNRNEDSRLQGRDQDRERDSRDNDQRYRDELRRSGQYNQRGEDNFRQQSRHVGGNQGFNQNNDRRSYDRDVTNSFAGAPSPRTPIEFSLESERYGRDRRSHDMNDRYPQSYGGYGNNERGQDYNTNNQRSYRGYGDTGTMNRDYNAQDRNQSSYNQNQNRGPKGYQRSDDRLREEICDCIMRQGNMDAGDVEIKVQSGEVTLSGTVSNKHEKRMIEDMAESIMGVKDVHNQLRVSRQSQPENASSTTSNQSSASTSGTSGMSASSSTPNGTKSTSTSRSRNDAE